MTVLSVADSVFSRLTSAVTSTRSPDFSGSNGISMSDRKSTRLNSSHLVISYAVFCLKKRPAHEQVIKAERLATLGQILSGIGSDVGATLNVISDYAEYLLMSTSPQGNGYTELAADSH